jgi:predicted Zn-dependent protease
MLAADRVIKLLRSMKDIDDWVVLETATRRLSRTVGQPGAAEAVSRMIAAVLFRDDEAGRGVAHVELDTDDESVARALIEQAAGEALLAVGPGWRMPPPAAPARVELADPDLVGNLAGVVGDGFGDLARATGESLELARGRFSAALSTHRVEYRQGFASEYQATRLSVDLLLAASGGQVERVRADARRVRDLRLAPRIAAAAEAMGLRRAAKPLEPGAYDLLLGPEALAMPRHGWFAPLVAQASGERIRLGLSRYRPGQRVFPAGGEGFTLISDGTIPFGLLSAPFGALGEPVRRFVLVQDGVAADPALDLREAALAGAPPNGGARNLVLSPGSHATSALREVGERPLLMVRELAWLDADPQSGDLTAEISLGTIAAAQPIAVTGGLVAGNAFELLGRARLGRDAGESGWYRGPQALRIDRVDVVR